MLKNRDFLTTLEQFQKKKSNFLSFQKKYFDENIYKAFDNVKAIDICIVSDVYFAKLCLFKGFLVFEIRKNPLY